MFVARPKRLDEFAKQHPRLRKHVLNLHDTWLRASQLPRSHWGNSAARRAFAQNVPTLDDAQRRVLGDLLSTGIAVATFTDFFGEQADLDRLADTANRWLASEDVKRREVAYAQSSARSRWKEYLIRLYEGGPIPGDSPWLALACATRLLDVVNTYMGMMSKIIHVDLWHTMPLREAEAAYSGSQRWHRDPEDVRLLKAFLYLNDIGPESGPLHYVPSSRHGDIPYGHLWQAKYPKGSVPPIDEFAREVPTSAWRVCTGNKGTFVLADTTGFHQGGRLESGNRVLSTWTYVSPSSVWPRVFDLTSPAPVASRGPAAWALR